MSERKVLHEDLYLGHKGERRRIRLYGPDGSIHDAYIELIAPGGDFSPVTYQLPASPVDGYYLKTNANGVLSWGVPADGKVYKAESVSQVGDMGIDLEAGQLVVAVVIDNKTDATCQVTIATTITGNNVKSQMVVNPLDVTASEACFIASLSNDTSLFLNVSQDGDTLNGCELDIYIVTRKIA